MPFITFIYKIGNNPKIYYGKYVCDSISDDHEGLDNEIKPALIEGLNKYRQKRGLTKIKTWVFIGILSFSSNEYIPMFSTNSEIKVFDFYFTTHIYHPNETFINGKLVI
jgi:hypothetical protein